MVDDTFTSNIQIISEDRMFEGVFVASMHLVPDVESIVFTRVCFFQAEHRRSHLMDALQLQRLA